LASALAISSIIAARAALAPAVHAEPVSAKVVAVIAAHRQDLSRTVAFSAELKPYEEADLHAKVAGYLKSISVDIGDRVKEGQTLARLDIDELREDLMHADAALKDAALNYERIQKVAEGHPGLLAQGDVDKAEAAYGMAKAQRERAATMLGYGTITAPFEGVITKRYVDPGALVQAGISSSSQAMPVVHIAKDTTLRLSFPVPESIVPEVKVGSAVDVTVEATGQHETNKIARLAGKIDTATRTMIAEVDIDNQDRRMTPGMFAAVKVVLQHKENVLALPVEALGSAGHPTVWVVNAKNELEERPVTIGMKTDSDVEVLSGVKEGESVVFGSRNALTLGMPVKPKSVAVAQAHE
jgi:RND family efflux transporter MFP subunit